MAIFRRIKGLQQAFAEGMANTEAATQAMMGVGEPLWLADKPLRGPAGQYLYGQHLSAQQRDELRAPVVTSADPAVQSQSELHAREIARAPYLASAREPLRITRVITRDGTQIEQVSAYLASSGLAGRPDLVFGLYRVPDHIDAGALTGTGRNVEWDIVHRDAHGLPPAPLPTVVWFDAAKQWASRRIGEPMVYDEDLALSYLTRAGLGAEQTIGVARSLAIHHEGTGGDSSYTASYVTGVHAFYLAGLAPTALAAFQSTRSAVDAPPAGTHVVALSWSSIREVVAPHRGDRPLIPSPFPYLPSTPQELLRAYIEIVGLRSSDCYAAAVTEDAPANLDAASYHGVVTIRTNRGAPQMCADGVLRPRLVGGARVVVAYRDHPDYAVGRERFAAFQRDVLRGQLELGAERRPLEHANMLDRLPGGLRGLARAAAAASRLLNLDDETIYDKLPPYRYCWPPS